MRKKIFLSIIVIIFIGSFINCHKSVPDSLGCGCDADSIITRVDYYNYLGYDTSSNFSAVLYFDTLYTPMRGWYIHVIVPRPDLKFSLLKICNPDLQSIKAIIDTIPKLNGVPIRGVSVLFAGKLKKLCINENQSFGHLWIYPTNFFYITVDSLKKK